MLIDVAEAWKKHTRYYLNRTETKLLVPNSKPWIHKGFPWIHKEKKTEIHQKNNLTKVCVY